MLCVVPPCSSSGLNVCNVGASTALTAPGRAAPLSAARQSLITVGCHRWGFPFELLARPGQAVVFQLDLYLGNYTSKECTSIYGKHKISGMGNFLVEPTFLFAYWQVCTLLSKKKMTFLAQLDCSVILSWGLKIRSLSLMTMVGFQLSGRHAFRNRSIFPNIERESEVVWGVGPRSGCITTLS